MSRLLKAAPLAVLCAFVFAMPPAWARTVQDGTPLCTATGTQRLSQITSDGANGAIVTWWDARIDAGNIYAQRVRASGAVQWTADGVGLCTTYGEQWMPTITSDGTGGAIVAWRDSRGTSRDIYAQRVNASGAVQWTANGVALCTATGNQTDCTIASDGAGGAIVTWMDYRGGNYDIYAQRVNASGAVQWTANGVALCTAAGDQEIPMITSDGAGGAIATWYDPRSGSNFDIYAQRVNASGAVQWTANGVALCTATDGQSDPTITSDGAGGAIVTWMDFRNGLTDIYAQRVNASGAVQWTADGVALCTAAAYQQFPQITFDGAGGAIVTWEDYRSGNFDIYAQRVNPSGVVQWTTDGIAVCAGSHDQAASNIASDGTGGAIITWEDYRLGPDNHDIYAQRVNASGAIQWTTYGVALCAATGNQQGPKIVSAGAGGAIVTWYDYRSGDPNNSDIYVQGIESPGLAGFPPPDILSVQDVPGDQGGWVRITIEQSSLDNALESAYPVALYNVWQLIDDEALLALVARNSSGGAPGARIDEAPLKGSVDPSSVSDWPVTEVNDRYFVQSKDLLGAGAFPPGTWELVGSFAACQRDIYIYRASTLADSMENDKHYSFYMVTAHTTTPSVWFASAPGSGYSVDNIPPGPPERLAAEQSYVPIGLQLTWNINQENDLSYYAIYRGPGEDFVPSPKYRVATPTDPEWFDGSWRWSSKYCYKISAVDVHGNESGFALLTRDDVTGTDTPKAPEASYLSQNYPNPFNPTTRIAFGLSAPTHVSLRIYDAAGRLVRALVNEDRRAVRYEESWDGCDSNGRSVASGIYFYRLNAGAFESTKKMILLR